MGNSEHEIGSETGVTIDDLRRFDFERILSKQGDETDVVEGRTCPNYSKNFIEESKLAASQGDKQREDICDLFAKLTSVWFHFDDDIKSSLPPPEISQEHLELLKQFAEEIKDPELRARVADILWYLRVDRAFQFAELAVDAYLEAVTRFNRVEAHVDRGLRIERALQIAARLGINGSKFASTIAFIETELKNMNEADILHGPAHLLRLLRKHKQGDPAVYIPYVTDLANKFEKRNGWEGARAVWYIARDWHRLAMDDEGARCAERRAAMTYEPEARSWMKLDTNAHFKVVDLLQRGLVALQRVGEANSDEFERVHKLLLEQQAGYDDYRQISSSVDISEHVESVKGAFRDQPLADCIYRLAEEFKPPSVDWLKSLANEVQAKNSLLYFIDKQLHNEQGRVIGRRPGNILDDSSLEESTRITMYEQASSYRSIAVSIQILPALEQINLDHRIRPNDLIGIVTNSPFVPPDRREIFMRGLYHGFIFDFMVASSLLVPQIENSLRYVLQQHGVIVSTLDSRGIQEEFDLGDLLYRTPEVEKMFGRDLLFDLKGLLHERFGSNLRNRLAHGLVTDNEYLSPASAYVWFMVLHLCCALLLARQAAQNSHSGDGENHKTADETSDGDSV